MSVQTLTTEDTERTQSFFATESQRHREEKIIRETGALDVGGLRSRPRKSVPNGRTNDAASEWSSFVRPFCTLERRFAAPRRALSSATRRLCGRSFSCFRVFVVNKILLIIGLAVPFGAGAVYSRQGVESRLDICTPTAAVDTLSVVGPIAGSECRQTRW